MKKLYLIAATLLFSVWAFAQGNSPSADPTAAQDKAGQSIEGCIAGSAGNFTLTDSSGKTFRLAGDTAKLSDHVGHTLRIWGSEKSGGADPEGSSSSASAQPTFTVQKVKMVAGTCPASK